MVLLLMLWKHVEGNSDAAFWKMEVPGVERKKETK